MEIIKNVVAVIGICLIISYNTTCFYHFVMDNDRKQGLKAIAEIIMQMVMLYGGYRIISFF